MKYKPFHTHKNPKTGRDEPLFLVIEGATCADCQAQRDKQSKRRARPLHTGPRQLQQSR